MLKVLKFLRLETVKYSSKRVINLAALNKFKYAPNVKRHAPCFRKERFYGSRNVYESVTVCGILTYLGIKEKTEEEKESELITTLKRSVLLIQKEEFKKAEQMLHLALRLAQEQKNTDGITYCYDLMANLAYDTGELAKAQKLFVNVMQRLMTSGHQAEDNKILHISVKLAQIYDAQNEKGKAEEGYKFCVENLEEKVKGGDHSEDTMLLWAMSLDYYAHFLLAQNRLQEASTCFKKAYDTCVQVSGSDQEQVVVLLNDLGTVSNLLGDEDKALEYFEKAVSLGMKLPEMKDLGSVLVNLGYSYLLKKMLNESEKACDEGRRVAIKYQDKEAEEEASACLKQVRGLINA